MRRATPAKAPSASGGHGQRLRSPLPPAAPFTPRSLKRDLCAFRAVVFPQRGIVVRRARQVRTKFAASIRLSKGLQTKFR